MIKEGNMAEKAVYSLTEEGEEEFRRLMFGISSEPVHMFLDFNAVIVKSGQPFSGRTAGLPEAESEKMLRHWKAYLEENIEKRKGCRKYRIPEEAVLRQQYILIQAI